MQTKPLSGEPYRVIWGELMNVDVDYDDKKELIANHPMLLPVDNSQEELNQSLQILAKASIIMSIPANKPSKWEVCTVQQKC